MCQGRGQGSHQSCDKPVSSGPSKDMVTDQDFESVHRLSGHFKPETTGRKFDKSVSFHVRTYKFGM